MEDYILEITNLTKKIKKKSILTDVNMHIKRNSVYGFLGPNGAGKSTTLKIISGLMNKSSGTILFNGREWTRKDLENIGSLIESPAIYANLSALENLEVLTTALGLAKTKALEVLDIVELSKADKKKVKNFSMGMKQRLGIAMALINSPQLLILDEPTNGLDPIAVQDLRDLIRGFANKNITTLISSHALSELELLADDISIMVKGKTQYEAKLDHSQSLENLFLEIIKQNQ